MDSFPFRLVSSFIHHRRRRRSTSTCYIAHPPTPPPTTCPPVIMSEVHIKRGHPSTSHHPMSPDHHPLHVATLSPLLHVSPLLTHHFLPLPPSAVSFGILTVLYVRIRLLYPSIHLFASTHPTRHLQAIPAPGSLSLKRMLSSLTCLGPSLCQTSPPCLLSSAPSSPSPSPLGSSTPTTSASPFSF